MATVTEEQILSCLGNIQDPEGQNDIVTLEMVKGLVVKNGNVGFSIEVEPARGAAMESTRKAATEFRWQISGGRRHSWR